MTAFKQTASVILAGSLLFAQITGFGTGSHFDVTRTVLNEHGFSEDGIKMVQVSNWLTDYYATSPTRSDEHRADLEKLHFDNLYSEQQVLDYWSVLLRNLRTSTESAAKRDDVFRMLIVIGIGLHAVQDFYAHSNWAELHPRGKDGDYRSDTIVKTLVTTPIPSLKALKTGKYPDDRATGPDDRSVPPDAEQHGSHLIGLNKDSPERPRWDEAYVFAYAASHELLDAMEKWASDVDPDFWQLVKAHKAAPGDEEVRLIRDYGAARNISMWFNAKGQNGIWKGHGSGSSRYFAAFSSKWLPAHRSTVMEEMHDGPLPLHLSAELYTGKRVPIAELPEPFSRQRGALLVRITYVGETKGGGLHPGRMLSVGGSDFYSKIIIDDQEFLGKTIQNKREAADPWFEVYIYDANKETIPITISVWDEDGIDPTEDRPADINPKAAAFAVSSVFDLSKAALLGEINGVFDTAERQFDLQGAKPDETRARIRGYITTRVIR